MSQRVSGVTKDGTTTGEQEESSVEQLLFYISIASVIGLIYLVIRSRMSGRTRRARRDTDVSDAGQSVGATTAGNSNGNAVNEGVASTTGSANDIREARLKRLESMNSVRHRGTGNNGSEDEGDVTTIVTSSSVSRNKVTGGGNSTSSSSTSSVDPSEQREQRASVLESKGKQKQVEESKVEPKVESTPSTSSSQEQVSVPKKKTKPKVDVKLIVARYNDDVIRGVLNVATKAGQLRSGDGEKRLLVRSFASLGAEKFVKGHMNVMGDYEFMICVYDQQGGEKRFKSIDVSTEEVEGSLFVSFALDEDWENEKETQDAELCGKIEAVLVGKHLRTCMEVPLLGPERRELVTVSNGSELMEGEFEFEEGLALNCGMFTWTVKPEELEALVIKNLPEECVSSSMAPMVDVLHVDGILQELLQSMPSMKEAMKYLMATYGRGYSYRSSVPKTRLESGADEKLRRSLRGAVVRFLGQLVSTQPAMTAELYDGMGNGDYGIRGEFFGMLVKHFAEHELMRVFSPLVQRLFEQTRAAEFEQGNFMEPAHVLRVLSEQEQMARVVMYSAPFSNAQPLLSSSTAQGGAQSISALSHSLLGRVLAMSPIPEFSSKSIEIHFSQMQSKLQSQVDESNSVIQERLHMLNGTLFSVIKNLVRNSVTRQDFLNWLATVLVSSKSRTQMGMGHPYQISFAGDASSLNLAVILVRLCEPFLVKDGETPAKLKGVNAWYGLADHPQSSYLGSETRLGATSEELLGFVSQQEASSSSSSSSTGMVHKEKGFSFVSQIFFMSMYHQHIGVMPVFEHFKKLTKMVQDMKNMLGEQGSSAMGQQIRQEYERNLSLTLAVEAHLISDQVLDPLIRLNMTIAAFVNGIIDPENKGPPLASEVPFQFRCLPEFVVEDMCEAITMLCYWDPERVLSVISIDHLIQFIILLVGEREYIRNPFLRSKLASVLHGLVEAEKQDVHSMSFNMSLASILRNNEMAKKHLVVSLAKLFADVEHTGRSGQFYERFGPRHEIANVFEYLWGIDTFRESFVEFGHSEVGITFLNFVLNDSTWILDEIFKNVKEVKSIQEEMASGEWNSYSEEEQQEKQQNLASAERSLRFDSTMAMDYINMMHYLSKDIPGPFISDVMVGRVAVMLDYFLFNLAGPKQLELKIKDMKKYHFHPGKLLSQIAQIYIHLCQYEEFKGAVVEDGRSYSHELLMGTEKILVGHKMLAMSEIEAFHTAAESIRELAEAAIEEEEELGEIPEEYLDSITYMLMSDPVRLPSGNIVDRKSFQQFLMNDSLDPFTRAKIGADDAVEESELKAEIEAWRKGKRGG